MTVLKFKKKRKETIRGIARERLTSALNGVTDPCAVVIVALGANGSFAERAAINKAGTGTWHDFDVYSRVGGIIERERQRLIE